MATFVTSTGFQKKTLAEIKTELEADFQELYGDDIDLDPSGPIGQFIGLISKDFADLWDGAQEVYTSRDPSSATQTSLDNIVLENGIERIPATPTTVPDVTLSGDDGTVIAAGKRAKSPNQTVEYLLDVAVTIDKTAARTGNLSVSSVVSGNTYTITIDAVNYDHIALITDDENDILSALKVLIDAGAWGGSVTVVENDLALFGTSDFSFDKTGDMDIERTGSAGNFTADTAGAFTLPGNSLTQIVTPVTNWDAVNNPNAGATGLETETDPEVRIRRRKSVNNGFATDDSIFEEITNNVANTTNVIVTSNRTDIVDSEGRDPHSFEAVITGGLDADIAASILKVQAAGIQSFGNTSVNIADSQGTLQPIYFSRAVSRYVWVRVSRDLYTEEVYPTDGDDQIKDAIVAWSLITTNINIGTDVIRQRLCDPVYSVQGIEDTKIEIDVTATPAGPPTYVEANFAISAREIAEFATARIVVQDLTP